jgi:hypothetical protein
MKTKKSAASAALKTTDKKSITSAPEEISSAPKPARKTAKPAEEAPVAPVAPVATAPAVTTPIAEPAPSAPPPAPTKEALTTIDVKIDVGFGNAVYLRGQGSGLTWEQGVPLSCVDGGTWRWAQTAGSPITFKVLLNDQVWSSGADLVVAPGQKLEVSPTFA